MAPPRLFSLCHRSWKIRSVCGSGDVCDAQECSGKWRLWIEKRFIRSSLPQLFNRPTAYRLAMATTTTNASPLSVLSPNKSYLDLANEAILCSPKRSGSSLQAIKQHIHSQYPDLDLKSRYLRAALKKAVSSERIVRVKGSFKISPCEKKALMRRKSIVSIVPKPQPFPSLSPSSPSHLQARTKQRSQQKLLQQPKRLRPIPRTNVPTLRSSSIKRRLRSFSSHQLSQHGGVLA